MHPASSLAAAYTAFCAACPERRYLVQGHHWAFVAAGSGAPPLLMLPGGFGSAQTSWRYVLALASQRQVISLHYPPTIHSIAALCDGLAALLDRLELAQIHLLGGSASGFVAQAFVRRYPSRVATLILAQSGAPRPKRAPLSRLLGWLCARLPMAALFATLRIAIVAMLPGAAPAQRFWRAHFVAVAGAQSRLALVNRFQLAADFDQNYRLSPADLAAWPGSIAIIESANDNLVSAAERTALRTLYPRAVFHSVSGSHNHSVLQPTAQIALIERILAT